MTNQRSNLLASLDYSLNYEVMNTTIITGICFGHQIFGRALGGGCVLNNKWEIGPTTINLSNLGKTLFGVDTLVR
jgi:GMP synthase-like glutamine amidotransferase